MQEIIALLKELTAELIQVQGTSRISVYCTIRLLLRNFEEVAREEGVSREELQPWIDELVRCCRIMAGLSDDKETSGSACVATAHAALDAIFTACSCLKIP
jgi:hypothetical protein